MPRSVLHVLLLLVAVAFASSCKKDQVEDKTLPIVVYYALPG